VNGYQSNLPREIVTILPFRIYPRRSTTTSTVTSGIETKGLRTRMCRATQCGAGLLLIASIIGGAHAENSGIRTVRAGSLALTPQNAGPSSAFVLGNGQQSGLYVITALYPFGLKSKPHVHPDQRVMTVISGTFYAGTGDKFDESKVQALPPGSILIIPPNTLHWGWAKDGDVVVQEVGVGPTGTIFPDSAPDH
jgi:quercetin dioxygenase-like cupin family protein